MWIRAGDLRRGDELGTLDGTATVLSVTIEPYAGLVYNLEVSDLPWFAVGAAQAIAHTGCPFPEADRLIPPSWGPGSPTRKKDGWRWDDKKGNGVRIDEAASDSPFPSQQVRHVRVRHRGRDVRSNGDLTPPCAPVSDYPDTHIPYDEWIQWPVWHSPTREK